MSVRDSRRQIVLERLADHVLQVGLRGASLRPLAAAAGTSNRMLLYYFTDKDELLTATIGHLSQRLLHLLNSSWPVSKPAQSDELLAAIWKTMQTSQMRPYMQLWLELAAIAARGDEPISSIAGQIADGFLAWAAARLKAEDATDRATKAAQFLITIEGMLVLDSVGRGAVARRALGQMSDGSG